MYMYTHTRIEEKVVNQNLIIIEMAKKLNTYDLPMSTQLIQDNKYHFVDLWIRDPTPNIPRLVHTNCVASERAVPPVLW